MRLFYAVDLRFPDALRDLVGPGPGHFHVTLRFLGETPAEGRPAWEAALAEAAGTVGPFDLELRGIGAFPNAHAPRVLWVGCGAGEAALTGLARGLEAALAARGLPPEDRPFRAHATLRRIRGAADERWARPLLARGAGVAFGSQRIGELVLYESRLSQSGAEHERLAAAPLAGPSP